MAFIDTINAKLIELLGPFGPLMAIGMLGVLLILLVLPAMMQRKADPLDRLKASNNARSASDTPERLRTSQGTDKLDKYSNFLEPQDKEEYSAI
ncbi:MAG: type II secretion system F family protein, partial [Octadecabacter sp.]